MNRINKFLMMLIAMVAIMITAVGIDKGIKIYEMKQWQKERVAYYEEARKSMEQIQTTIQSLASDPEALKTFIEENELNYIEVYEEAGWDEGKQEDSADSVVTDSVDFNESIPGNEASDYSVSGNGMWNNSASDNSVSDNNGLDYSISGNSVSGNNAWDGGISGNSVSGNNAWDGSVSGNSVSGNSVSDNSVSDNSVWRDNGSGSSISGNNFPVRKRISASYGETLRMNKEDKLTIANNQIDFSDMKIACLGDSITAATNLDELEDYEAYSYPSRLKELLGAKKVTNLGIGGSSIGRYWDQAFVDRYRDIPKDTDLIIVMGGTNDGFCATQKELGSLESREKRTFAGDLDELMKGLKKEYPDAMIVFATPLPNVLHDMLRKDSDSLLPQTAFVKMIRQLSHEYEIPVIDLYHANLLDTHDAAVIYNFMPDGVHGNAAGYQILAEHLAAEIIKLYEQNEGKDE